MELGDTGSAGPASGCSQACRCVRAPPRPARPHDAGVHRVKGPGAFPEDGTGTAYLSEEETSDSMSSPCSVAVACFKGAQLGGTTEFFPLCRFRAAVHMWPKANPTSLLSLSHRESDTVERPPVLPTKLNQAVSGSIFSARWCLGPSRGWMKRRSPKPLHTVPTGRGRV